MILSVHVFIEGKVQGVFYRQSTYAKATQLGIKGWVRNLIDGRVEAVFEGEESSLIEIISWCKLGPPLANVKSVRVEPKTPEDLKDFTIK